jgi:hypothetical protein
LVENIDHLVPATLYQYSQCIESYGLPKDVFEKAPKPTIEDRVKDQIACIVIPDEPNEDPMEKVRHFIRNRFQDIESINERFDRLFLSVRKKRRRYSSIQ